MAKTTKKTTSNVAVKEDAPKGTGKKKAAPKTAKERATQFKPGLKTNSKAKAVAVFDFGTGKKRFSAPIELRKRNKSSKEVVQYMDVEVLADQARAQSITKRSIVKYGVNEALVDGTLCAIGAGVGVGIGYLLFGGTMLSSKDAGGEN